MNMQEFIDQLARDVHPAEEREVVKLVLNAQRERRERIAIAALQGFAAGLDPETMFAPREESESIASGFAIEALRWADALIAELDKKGE